MTKPKPKKEIKMYTLKEAADKAGIPVALLRVYCRLGAFDNAVKKRGTRWTVSEDDINDLIHDRIDFTGIHAQEKKAKKSKKK